MTFQNKQIEPAGPIKAQSEKRWIPILDYAVLKGISTSTLRRYIKARKIEYKIENGRYLLLADEDCADLSRTWDGFADVSRSPAERMQQLEEKLLRAEEQISELKMLVAIYEEKLAQLDQ